MQRAAATVDAYLASLPADRRAHITRVRDVVRAKLPPGYEEGVAFGMISWFIPLSRYPTTYNKQPLLLASLAAQKSHNALYLMTVYGDPALEKAFRAGFAAAGKKLDMGKSCVRFAKADDLALDVIGDTIGKVSVDAYIASYEKARAATSRPAKAAKTANKKPAGKKPATKTPAAKQRAAKKPATKIAANRSPAPT